MNTKGTMIATLKSTSSQTKAPNGSFEAILSVPVLDRDKEIVDAKAFDPLPDHITIDLDHAMTVEKTVGSGRPFYDGEVLKLEGTFASTPLAQMTRALVDEGHIRTMSVAYNQALYEVDKNDGQKHLRQAELLNAGIVGIPANREALITASKSLIGEPLEHVEEEPITKTGARHNTKDVALLQTAHDALVQLGVTCETKQADSEEISTETTTESKAVATADEAAAAAEPLAAVHVGAMAKVRALAAEAELALL